MVSSEEGQREQECWWVLRAQSGDRDAFDCLLRAVQEPLYRCVLSLAEDSNLAEDVLQEVFLRLWRKLSWLREPRLFRSWAYRIAIRETFRRLKREKRWREQTRDEALLDAFPAPPETPEWCKDSFCEDILERLPSLVSGVSAASRIVLVLHYEQGLTLDEVADVLDIPAGTARSRLAYGLAQLRRRVRASGPIKMPPGRREGNDENKTDEPDKTDQ